MKESGGMIHDVKTTEVLMKKTNKVSIGRIVMALCLALALSSGVLLSGCSLFSIGLPPKPVKPNFAGTLTIPTSYDDIYDALAYIMEMQNPNGGMFWGVLDNADGAPMPAAPGIEALGIEAKEAASGSNSSYSQTNVQVRGIDEGDIVKTDGKSIFIVSGAEVVIMRADGANTIEVARIKIEDVIVNKNENSYPVYPRELYVVGNTLVILYDYSIYEMINEPTYTNETAGSDASVKDYYYPSYNYQTFTEVACFDISDPAKPRLVNVFGQDGSYLSSRLQDGILYLISSYWIYNYLPLDRDCPEMFVPAFYTGAAVTLVAPRDVCILPDLDSAAYTVITSIDVAKASRIDQQSILGSNNTLYMSYDNLYLANGVFDEVVENSYKDGSFTVTEYRQINSTRIIKFSIADGKIDYIADGLVPGVVVNQFALDEYEGYLRIVTTVYSNSYRTLEDSKSKIYDYGSYEFEPPTNALYILDKDLEESGSITGLAEKERVYSVRFDGAVGYFVTFERIDPLFSVDLSDPKNPKIQGALKIPGFSTYMHIFGENRLFGFGMATDEDGRTQGLKLSMFDTTDPFNITEKHVFNLGDTYSNALYDHKAIIIDAEKNLIGFPVGDGYEVYGYSDERGFYKRQAIEFKTDEFYYYYFNQRGLYIDTYFYICAANNVGVYTLDTLVPVVQIPIEVDDGYFNKPLPFVDEAIATDNGTPPPSARG